MKKLQVKDLMVTGAFRPLLCLCWSRNLVELGFDRSGNMMYAPAGATLWQDLFICYW